MKNPIVKQIPCWNCRASMHYYATAGVYHFFKCAKCGVEQAVWILDETMTGDRDDHPTRPETPRAFTGSISGDRHGGRHVKETNS